MYTKLLLALSAFFLLSVSVLAAPGDLDASFGSGGIARSHFARESYDQTLASALQPDGKIVVVGFSQSNHPEYTEEGEGLIVCRFNTDGTLDPTFGVGGTASKVFMNGSRGTAVLLQPDGKIIVGGSKFGGGLGLRSFMLTRFNSNGSVDSSFGADGTVETSSASFQSILTSLALQTDGKIIAAGYTLAAPSPITPSMIVTRYNIDGSPDSTFDSDGVLLFSISNLPSRANAVAVQTDGKIVLSGNVRASTSGIDTDFALVRVNSDGSFDNSFDGDGKVVSDIGTSSNSIAALAILPDGKIIATGNAINVSDRDILTVRYNTDGSLDHSFDSDGILITNIGFDVVTGIAQQSDGKIVLCGRVLFTADPSFQFLSVRLTTSGAPDSSYNGTGWVATRIAALGVNSASAVVIQSDGKIVLTGYVDNFQNSDIALARYSSNGTLDPTFDSDGQVTIELGNSSERATKIALQPDGKIVAVGDSYSGGFLDMTVARFNANGSIDASFGVQGFVTHHFPEENGWASDVEVQSDGKILVAVNSLETPRFIVFRFYSSGNLDPTFGTGGISTVQVGASNEAVYDLAIQPDGKIVAAGSGGVVNALIRLNSDGSLDTTFGSMGKVLIPDSDISHVIRSITLDATGRIYAAAGTFSMTSPGNSQFAVMRLSPNGSLDSSFGGGIVHTSFSSQGNASTLALQSDGKVVVSGTGWEAYPLARYNTNGSLDTSFDGDGKVITPGQPGTFPGFRQILVQPNGKIVAGGSFDDVDVDASIFRYNGDGSLDSSFGVGGKVITSLGDGSNWYQSLLMRPNGKLIGGGASSNGLNYDFTLAQYVGDATSRRSVFDFDGDGKTDIGIFRPSGGEWWVNRSGDGETFALQFGSSTDKITPADYTGDGKSDIAFFRPGSGEWYVLRSEDFSFFALPFGTNGDVPVPADYDADGKADFAVFRPSTSTWFISQSSGAPTRIFQFGSTGDVPVVSDYDADGKADVGIFRAAAGGGEWWIDRSTAGLLALQFGASTDKPAQGDYTGDGKADVAIWRPTTGEWFIVRSEDFSFYGFPFGTTGDVLAPGDYDGDGKFDPTVFRPSSATWFSGRTTAGTLIVQFGATGDRPVANAFVP